MVDDEMIHEGISAGYNPPDFFATRTLIFYISSSIWLVVQIIFWIRILIHFFNHNESKIDLLDDAEF